MYALSRLEHNATKHIRSFFQHHKTEHVKLLAYIISLISCLSAGSVMIISLYSLTWLTKYHYTSMQANLISSAVNIGGYLTPPLLGLMCDNHGPVVLSMTSLLTYVPHYYILSKTDSESNFNLVLYCFFMIGIGTSALFFSALISCSKFYPESKLLSISLPTTSYGISSIWLGYVVTHFDFFNQSIDVIDSKNIVSLKKFENFLNLQNVYKFFSLFYLLISVFDWVSTSIVSRLKKETAMEQQQQQALLPQDANSSSGRGSSNDDNDTQPLLSTLQPTTSVTSKLMGFYKDPSAYLLLLVMFISIGSMEMYITNMGTITELYDHKNKHAHYDPQKTLASFSLNSTVIRLIIGIMIDFCSKKLNIRNMEIFVLWTLLVIGIISQIMMLTSNKYLMWATPLMGMTYGGVFTTMPIVVLSHWGAEIFGTAYGSCMIAPALGSTVFGIVFANIFQKNQCSVEDDSCPYTCVGSNFQTTTITFVIALFIAMFIYLGMWRKTSSSKGHIV